MHDLPRSFKLATIWLLLGLALFLAVQAWQHRQAQTRFMSTGGMIEIVRAPDGHYHWPGRINGRDVEFLIDTGATGTAMSLDMARELGLPELGNVRSTTAGGLVTGTVVRADVELQGGVAAQGLRIVALPGLGDKPLLGMDVLGRLRWSQDRGVLKIDSRNAAR
ncbi:retropepsin-like aspartic protease family protein [Piscinibacter sakaiensis]|uniref:retropepsin-like aspartic protease family protein n=1 Tax=Piscinibacter sakaiensis TaxID=1547922 RepID=UPI003AB00B78